MIAPDGSVTADQATPCSGGLPASDLGTSAYGPEAHDTVFTYLLADPGIGWKIIASS